MASNEKKPSGIKAFDIEALRGEFALDKNKFTETVENILLQVRKKEDIESVLELFTGLKNEIGDISPFLSSAINPVLTLMIKNHYYKQISEHAGLFELCANITVYRLLEDLINQKNHIRFLTTFEVYRIKKMLVFLAKKFQKDDVAYRLELELEKEDLNWRDTVD